MASCPPMIFARSPLVGEFRLDKKVSCIVANNPFKVFTDYQTSFSARGYDKV